jgi:putative lipoic acid-binding regulatory protein
MRGNGGAGSGNGDGSGLDRPLLTFPCRYDLKAVGRQSAHFEALVQAIVSNHVAASDLLAVRHRLSREGHYLSITFIIQARSYSQLDALYRDLGACADVLFCI